MASAKKTGPTGGPQIRQIICPLKISAAGVSQDRQKLQDSGCRAWPGLASWDSNAGTAKSFLFYPRSAQYERARKKPMSYQRN